MFDDAYVDDNIVQLDALIIHQIIFAYVRNSWLWNEPDNLVCESVGEGVQGIQRQWAQATLTLNSLIVE